MANRQATGVVLAALLAGTALASPAAAQLIDFESETVGGKPNGYVTDDSPVASFTDTSGSNLRVSDFGNQGIGSRSLAVGEDDASGLQIDFTTPVSDVTLTFGNDDPAFTSPGDAAWLRGLLGGNVVGEVSVTMNRDDIANQTITLGALEVDQAVFWYGDSAGNPINLIEIVDNISFTILPVLPVGPSADDELSHLASAMGTIAPIIVRNVRDIARGHGQESLASRDSRLSFTRVTDAATGDVTVTQSTQGAPGLVGNVYSWIELSGFNAEDDDAGRSYTGRGLQIGADMALSNDMVVGLSLGVQDLDATVGAFSQDGVLRYLQPYLAYQSGAWSGEASLIWGLGDFDQTSAGGAGTGETRLTAISFTGGYDMPLDAGVTVTPTIGLSHGRERVEGTGGTLAGAGTETIRFTEISLGAELSQAITGGEVFAGLHLDWLDTSAETQLVSDLMVDDGWTGRLELGLSTDMGNGLLLDTSVALSGLGGSLNSTSGSLNFAFRF